jgi:phospholipid/cholesterol/gamma-HCH transport system substrate-binding protein
MSGRRTLLVSAFIASGLVAMVGILFMFTDRGVYAGRYTVTTNVPDAGGIRKGDPVRLRGVNVGRVAGFKIRDEGVDIQLDLESEYPVPRDSEVRLVSAGLIGGMMANVVPEKSAERARDHDALRGRSEDPSRAAEEIALRLRAMAESPCPPPTSGATK